MDWLILACCLLMAWVTLAVVAGERLYRQQAQQLRQAQAGAAEKPGGPKPH
ncbi:MAG: hypothetical protein NZ561_06700 [Phycisphaerae bacterium]|nr:hypothetical protein [Phycisphaerae bacterium]MDW8261450.1 hypothetical protein [Phycisphaerales bacterium]